MGIARKPSGTHERLEARSQSLDTLRDQPTDGPQLFAGDICDFAVALVTQQAQDQHFALVLRQGLHGPAHGLVRIAAIDSALFAFDPLTRGHLSFAVSPTRLRSDCVHATTPDNFV